MTSLIHKLTTDGTRLDQIQDPQPAPILPILYSVAIAVATVILASRCGIRVTLIAAVLIAVALLSRIPRILPVTAATMLALAAVAILLTSPTPTRSAAGHASRTHAITRSHAPLTAHHTRKR